MKRVRLSLNGVETFRKKTAAVLIILTVTAGIRTSCAADTPEQERVLSTGPGQKLIGEITKESVIGILEMKEIDPACYAEILTGLSDEQYMQFIMYLPAAELAVREEPLLLDMPVLEGQGAEYIRSIYGIDIESIGTEEFTQLMLDMKLRNPQSFYDIIGNIPDELYEAFYTGTESDGTDRGNRRINGIIPFAADAEGRLKSGTALLEEDGGVQRLPEQIMFQICYSDGTQDYIYSSSPGIRYITEGMNMKVSYTDANGCMGECLLTEDRHFVFSGAGAEDCIFPMPGDEDIHSVGRTFMSETK